MGLTITTRLASLCGIGLVGGMLMSPSCLARGAIPGYELVYNAPIETRLANPDITDTTVAWRKLINAAHTQLDIGEFYVSDQPPSKLTQVIDRLAAAGKRGVHIHLLVENGVDFSTSATLERLASIPNLTLRRLAYRNVGGGIIHAKYMIADGKVGYLGSANFDWRSLGQIQETGLLVTDSRAVGQMQEIFDLDWHQQQLLAGGHKAQPVKATTTAVPRQGNFLIASPRRFNPAGVVDSEDALKQLLAQAHEQIRIQVMTYSPLGFAAKGQRQPYYPLIDQAIREAAARGVHIELMVADWSLGKNRLPWLKSLAMVPNITIKAVTIPPAKSGPIPFARVIHSKFMTIDGKVAWVGTSNWDGGYLNDSRNLEVVMHNAHMAARLDRLFLQLWHSPYAKSLDMKTLPISSHGGS